MSWRETTEETRPMLSLGSVTGSVVLKFQSDGKKVENNVDGEVVESVRFPVQYEQGLSGHTDKNGNELQSGNEYYLYTGSARFLNELKQIADNLDGKRLEVDVSGENFTRDYKVSEA